MANGASVSTLFRRSMCGVRLSRLPGHAARAGLRAAHGYTAAGYADGGSDTFHFPDGNASIARLLVRTLFRQHSRQQRRRRRDARAEYSRLDRAASTVRIRLGSSVVRVRNIGEPPAAVEIAYLREGKMYSVRARSCVLAGYNMMIPYLCPDLPERQKEALRYAVKIPLIYTSVHSGTGGLSRRWESSASMRRARTIRRCFSTRSSISEITARRVRRTSR